MPAHRLIAALFLCVPALAQEQPPAPSPPPPPAEIKPDAKPDPKPETPATPRITPIPHVEIRGTGSVPMILVPALVCDWQMYDAFMLRNAQRFTMYAVTLPGFGASQPPPAPPQGQSYAQAPWMENAERAILKLVEEKKLDKPVLLGVSTGGHIALRTAIRNPDAFRSLIIVNGLPSIPLGSSDASLLSPVRRAEIVDEEYARQLQAFPDDLWTTEQANWIKRNFPDAEHARAVLAAAAPVPKSTAGRYMLEYFASDLTDRLSKLKLPLLAVSSIPSAEDPESQSFRDAWTATYAKLDQAKLAYFEGGTEFLTEDSPLELDKAIEQFLDGKAVDGKAADLSKKLPPKTENIHRPPPQVEPAKPPEPK